MRLLAVPASPVWNAATGGTVTDVANYDGTGHTYRVHVFTSGSLIVTQSTWGFDTFVVGGGGGGNPYPWYDRNQYSGDGGTVVRATRTLTPGTYSFTIGAAGIGGIAGNRESTSGGSSIGFGATAAGGAAKTWSGSGTGVDGSGAIVAPWNGGLWLGKGGGAAGSGLQTAGYGNGGGGYDVQGKDGTVGVVAVAYRIS